MKITKKALEIINESNSIKAKLCCALNASYDSVQRWIRENRDDGKLTTIKAIDIIKESTELSQAEILTE